MLLSSLRSTPQMSFLQPADELTLSRLHSSDHMMPAIPQIAQPTSTAERWASYVLGACVSARDPRTLGIWARQVAVSYTTLCESCRLIGVSPRCARDFARVLRLILMPSLDACDLTCLLDISDRRTLDSILEKAGFGRGATVSAPITVTSFLDNQKFIALENAGLGIIRAVFALA
jgi:hypothetical protein